MTPKNKEKEHTLIETAGLLEKKIMDVVSDVNAGKLTFKIKNNEVYFTDSMLDDYIGLTAPKTRQKSKPEPVKEPEWLKKTRTYLDNVDDYVSRHGAEKVERVVNQFSSVCDESIVKKIFAADKNETILKSNGKRFGGFINTFYRLVEQINNKYGNDIPKKYSIMHSPKKFLPKNIKALDLELNPIEKEEEPQKDSIDLMVEDIGYSRKIIEGLENEGYNIYFLEAIIKEGFKLKASHSRNIIGEQYLNIEKVEKNIRNYLKTKNINHNPKEIDKTMKNLGDLIIHKKSGNCITFNPKWADITEGNLKEYLQQVFEEKEKHNGNKY